MHIITRRVKLVASPQPFVGSRIRLRIGEDGKTVRISQIGLAAGCEAATIDWGDGSVERVAAAAAHAYGKAGVYEVRISDEIAGFEYNSSSGPDDAPLAFFSNASRLTALLPFCFSGCADLGVLDVRESGVEMLGRRAFADCVSLSGEICFPRVKAVEGTAKAPPFVGCSGGITKIHFARENEAVIRSSVPFLGDPTLGTGTAECVFDL